MKALTLLEVMASARETAVGISDLAAATDLPMSTTHRLLKALEARGFIGRQGTKYTMGARFLQLGEAFWRSEYAEMRRRASTSLERLFEWTGATVQLAVPDGRHAIYLEKITGRGGCAIPTCVGQRVPVSCTGVGKAMLAFSSRDLVGGVLSGGLRRMTENSIVDAEILRKQLDTVRSGGVALDQEEFREGVFCIAAPVLSLGRPIAAVSLTGQTARICDRKAAELVRATARRLEHDITAPD
jgi:DNA-binding IclR family transcriptional regulator